MTMIVKAVFWNAPGGLPTSLAFALHRVPVCAGAAQCSAVAAEVWIQENGCTGTQGTEELRASPQLLRGVYTAVQATRKAAEKQQ